MLLGLLWKRTNRQSALLWWIIYTIIWVYLYWRFW